MTTIKEFWDNLDPKYNYIAREDHFTSDVWWAFGSEPILSEDELWTNARPTCAIKLKLNDIPEEYATSDENLFKRPESNSSRVYCDLIKAWADGANIQYFDSDSGSGKWIDIEHPIWYETILYRIKPKTIIVNGREINAPADRLEAKKYYVPMLSADDLYCKVSGWYPSSATLLNRGLLFETKEDAIAYSKAVLGID